MLLEPNDFQFIFLDNLDYLVKLILIYPELAFLAPSDHVTAFTTTDIWIYSDWNLSPRRNLSDPFESTNSTNVN